MSANNLRTAQSSSLRDTLEEQRPWVLALLGLNLLDVATTAVGLEQGLPEGNPIQAMVLADHGELAMFLSKVALVAGLILVLHVLRGRFRHLWPFGLAMTVPTLLVVVNNLILVARVIG